MANKAEQTDVHHGKRTREAQSSHLFHQVLADHYPKVAKPLSHDNGKPTSKAHPEGKMHSDAKTNPDGKPHLDAKSQHDAKHDGKECVKECICLCHHMRCAHLAG